jgi:hypothetical protein
MKKLTRDRVVPIISARVSWLIFAITGSGVPSGQLVEPDGCGLAGFSNSSLNAERRPV